MKGNGGVAGEGRVASEPTFHSWVSALCHQLRSDAQHFLWPVYYIALYHICHVLYLGCNQYIVDYNCVINS